MPSEWNTADGPSRGSKFPSAIVEHPGHGDSQTDRLGTSSDTMPSEEGEGCQHTEAEGARSQERKKSFADSRGGVLGERISGAKMSSEVSGVLEPPPSRSRCPFDGEDQCTNGRQGIVPDAGHYVFGGGGHQPGQLHDSSSGVYVASPTGPQADESAHCKAVPSRMEEIGPTRLASSFTLGSRLPDGEVHDEPQHEGAVSDDVTGFRVLPPTGRSETVEGPRFGPASQQQQQVGKIVESGVTSSRERSGIKDSGVRRKHSLRSQLYSLHSKGGVSVAGAGECARQQEDFLERDCGAAGSHDNGCNPVPNDSAGRCSSIPPTARRSFKGFRNSGTRPSSDPTSRPVEDNGFSEAVRKRRSVKPTASQSASGGPSAGSRRHQTNRKNHPIPALSPSTGLTVQVFLEIFCGCARLRLSHAVAKVTGWAVLMWDITLGPEYDLTKSSNRRLILEWVRCNWVVGFHLGTPCESFSRARDVPPGPPPLRSNDRPLGLDGLRAHDQLKVMIGNLFVRLSAALLILGWKLKAPGNLENPERSRLWLCHPIQAVLRKRGVQFAVTHFCCLGTPYRKATGFLGVHLNLDRLENVKCRSSKRGICQYSGCRHMQLHGRNPDGQWLTKLTQPYPQRMCTALAKCFLDWELSLFAAQFSKHW